MKVCFRSRFRFVLVFHVFFSSRFQETPISQQVKGTPRSGGSREGVIVHWSNSPIRDAGLGTRGSVTRIWIEQTSTGIVEGGGLGEEEVIADAGKRKEERTEGKRTFPLSLSVFALNDRPAARRRGIGRKRRALSSSVVQGLEHKFHLRHGRHWRRDQGKSWRAGRAMGTRWAAAGRRTTDGPPTGRRQQALPLARCC